MAGVSRDPGTRRPVPRTEAGTARITGVQDRYRHALFAQPGVNGHGIGADADGAHHELIVTLLADEFVPEPGPWSLDGVPLRLFVTGVIRPM
jgi:hypothetical protein